MTPPVRLTPAAVQDVILAERWYLEEAPHVVASFRKEIDKALGRISERPASYQTGMPSRRPFGKPVRPRIAGPDPGL